MKKIICLFLSIFLISCQETVTEQTSESKVKTEEGSSNSTLSKNASVGSDTVLVRGRSVVFFSINQEEYDRILKEEGEDSGINEILDDFNYYASEVADSLNKAGFRTLLTTNKTFIIEKNNGQRNYVTRNNKKGEVGVLLFDGLDEPKVDYGVGTDIDYFVMVQEYFKKK
ncbi:hypothetical protein [Pontibacter liquoris]|uniref:hypothetical protein n=1 Tax=Pontibacter liquoris TaxID=2905677 RepID=UPI001FA7BB23|nr:hypothetical protein [Pontibacter liquoris]